MALHPEAGACNVAVSAIVPVHNGAATLGLCLEALRSCTAPPLEIIVVDDFSDDASRHIAVQLGCSLAVLQQRSYQARARNVGARIARAEVLLFVDADIVVDADTVEKALGALMDGEADAVVVPFRPDSPANDFCSQYKHLIMTFNQMSFSGAIRWTNTSCLMVRRRAFEQVGGFDESLPRATCEDFQFGLSLARNGARVLLEKRTAVWHHRSFVLRELALCQLRRSIAFGRILASSLGSAGLAQFPVAMSIRLSSIALPSVILCLAGASVYSQLAWAAALAGTAYCVLNWGLFRYLAAARGRLFATAACGLLALDSAGCAAAFLFGFVRELWRIRVMPVRTSL